MKRQKKKVASQSPIYFDRREYLPAVQPSAKSKSKAMLIHGLHSPRSQEESKRPGLPQRSPYAGTKSSRIRIGQICLPIVVSICRFGIHLITSLPSFFLEVSQAVDCFFLVRKVTPVFDIAGKFSLYNVFTFKIRGSCESCILRETGIPNQCVLITIAEYLYSTHCLNTEVNDNAPNPQEPAASSRMQLRARSP